MTNIFRHSFHLVDESPWPVLSSLGGVYMALGFIFMFFLGNKVFFFLSLAFLCSIVFQWWMNVKSEGTFQGIHTLNVESGLRLGVILFIVSEVLFFFSFFWAFFHSSLAPSIFVGSIWPPLGVCFFDPFSVPLLNTVILLFSGLMVTWSHYSILSGNHSSGVVSLIFTIVLGLYFTILQGYEYYEASFSISDSVYGSTFFLATGFHGFHVIVGSTFLLVCLFRMVIGDFSYSHHFGYEAAIWYWHFVDVVWLFLFLSIYWWGGLHV